MRTTLLMFIFLVFSVSGLSAQNDIYLTGNSGNISARIGSYHKNKT